MNRLQFVIVAAFTALMVLLALGGGGGGLSPEAQLIVSRLLRALSFEDYNTRLVVVAATLLGTALGAVGCFVLLRKRALVGDVLSHATLPGIGLAFLFSTFYLNGGKELYLLLAGAALSGLLGLGIMLVISRTTKLKEDAAQAIVLSVFFGAGIAILGVIQRLGRGHAAGLESFIYGKTGSMVAQDAYLLLAATALTLTIVAMFFKEFRLLCFDASFARTQGYPLFSLDLLLMGLVLLVTIIGLQAVGLILVTALLIIPAAAARFWTERLSGMLFISAAIGAVSAAAGAFSSAVFADLPSGPMIVLTAAGCFLISLLFGAERGAVLRLVSRARFQASIRREHLLRAIYELTEFESAGRFSQHRGTRAGFSDLLQVRSWSPKELEREIRSAVKSELVVLFSDGSVRLTEKGFIAARRLVKTHRLLEMFMLKHADAAPSVIDRDADYIEHVLGPEMVEKLEQLLGQSGYAAVMPGSPHELGPKRGGAGHA